MAAKVRIVEVTFNAASSTNLRNASLKFVQRVILVDTRLNDPRVNIMGLYTYLFTAISLLTPFFYALSLCTLAAEPQRSKYSSCPRRPPIHRRQATRAREYPTD